MTKQEHDAKLLENDNNEIMTEKDKCYRATRIHCDYIASLEAEIDNLKVKNAKLENSIVHYALEIQVLKEAIRNCAVDRSLGGNNPVQQYIDDAWKDVKPQQKEKEKAEKEITKN